MNMTMRWSWPEHKATGIQHTVETPGGRRAGFLVRSSTSSTDLGYIWPVGNAWMWRTPDGKNFGERSSQVAAVKVLRQAFDLRGGREPRLPFEDGLPAPGSQASRPPQAPGSRLQGSTAPRPPQAPGSGSRPPQASRPPRPPQAPGSRPPGTPGSTAPRPPQAPGSGSQASPAPQAPDPPMKRIVWADQSPDLTNTLGALLHPTKNKTAE